MLFCLLRRNTIEGVLKNAIDWASRPHGDLLLKIGMREGFVRCKERL
jgi:NAD(P)H-dependent FMN reductase